MVVIPSLPRLSRAESKEAQSRGAARNHSSGAGDEWFRDVLTNASRRLYTGVTSNLQRRVWEHKEERMRGFTQKYHLHELVYFEVHGDIRSAIAREKQIKGWGRRKKIALIESVNPLWKDLSADWYRWAEKMAKTKRDSSLRSE